MTKVAISQRPLSFLCLACALALFFAGCETPTRYQAYKHDEHGGYSQKQLSESIHVITYKGAGYSVPDQVHDYALLSAAEFSISRGFPFFEVIKDSNLSKTHYTRSGGRRRLPPQGAVGSLTGSYVPDDRYPITVPAFELTIRLHKTKNDPLAPPEAIREAAPLIKQLRAKHNLPPALESTNR